MTPGDAPLVQDIGPLPAAFDLFSPVWDSAPAVRSLATWLVPFSLSLENGASVLRDTNGNILWRGPVDFARPESSGVTLVGALVAEDDFPLYAAAREEIARRLAPPPATPRSLPATNALRFTSLSLDTNGVLQLDLASPADGPVEIFARPMAYTSSVVTVVWTNDENTVVTNTSVQWNQAPGEAFRGTSDVWTRLGLATVSNGIASFPDPAITNDSYRVCFYLAHPYADSDSDGLSDASERWTFHTDPHAQDSDGDGWTDSEEVTAGTAPLDRLSAPRLARGVLLHAVKYAAPADEQWLQLHCSAPRPVDLSGFRIQVAGTNWETKATLPPDTWLVPGHFLLFGGVDVTNADLVTDWELQNSYPDLPTAGVRLMPPVDSTNGPVDTLLYGTHVPFNEQALDTTGWLDATTNLWASPSRHLERCRLGLDTDHESDWKHEPDSVSSPPHNSEAIVDSDGDGIPDEDEYSAHWLDDIETDPLDWDTDGDGLSDGYERRNGLLPDNDDSDGDGILDGAELADGTHTHDWVQIRQGVSVDWVPSSWPMGSSIGANGTVQFTVTDVPDMGVWAILREGGHEPESLDWSASNAEVAYSARRQIDGFDLVFLWLIPAEGSSGVLSVSDASNGQVTTPGFEGPDVTAHFIAVDVKLHWDWQPVPWGSYQYLLPEPRFPSCFVSLLPEFNDWDECRVAWRLQIAYSRHLQNSVESFPSDGSVLWRPGIWFDFADIMGDNIRGGTATVSCRPENSSRTFQRVFYIRGTNPDNSDVEAMFAGQPWYALGIARQESSYRTYGTYCQFNEPSQQANLGPNPEDFLWCPNWGYPDGWGIMQLDPPPSPQHMWDWRTNVTAGLTRMEQKRQEAETYLNTQITQQMEDNPEDTLASRTFSIGGVDFRVGTAKTPLDACTIQAYNGAAHFVIYWKRKTATEPGSWEINPTQTGYIENVLDCLELP